MTTAHVKKCAPHLPHPPNPPNASIHDFNFTLLSLPEARVKKFNYSEKL